MGRHLPGARTTIQQTPIKLRETTTLTAHHKEDSDEASLPLSQQRGSSSSSPLDRSLESMSRYFQSLDSVESIQKDLVRRAFAFTELQLSNENDTSAADSAIQQQQERRRLVSSIRKVPGCVANVHIRTVLTSRNDNNNNNMRRQHETISAANGDDANANDSSIHSATNDDDDGYADAADDDYTVQLEGSADAMVSRGLLATLVAVLAATDRAAEAEAAVTAREILHIPPDRVAQRVGLDRALSPGRNDGMASLWRTVQDQIQQLLVAPPSKTRTNPDDEWVVAPNGQSDDIMVARKANDNLSLWEKANVTTSTTASASAASSQQEGALRRRRQPTVALLLSGGVDSSVALHLLLQQGYNVTAFYLKIWLQDELAHLGTCPWEDDYRTCQAVCAHAAATSASASASFGSDTTTTVVPLESVSLQQAYQNHVLRYTVQEAQHGRTPNPDIMCNSRVKFGCFYDAIADRDFDFVATGHYAQVVRDNDDNNDNNNQNRVRLLRAPDPVKDQSYFLCALTQEQLQRVLFPIGHLEKRQVRQLAQQFGLPNRNRPDSQGLCFLGKVKFEDFLHAHLGQQPGDILDAATGDVLGRHNGCWYHTVGQRRGIGKVLNPLATSRGPWYVVAKDPARNVIYCSNQYDQDMFTAARSEFTVENIHWIAGNPPVPADHAGGQRQYHLTMKVRHGPKLVNGTLTLTGTNSSTATGDIQLQDKDSGLAPGQYVAFYLDEECLGGGVISERHWAKFLLERNNNSSNNEALLSLKQPSLLEQPDTAATSITA